MEEGSDSSNTDNVSLFKVELSGEDFDPNQDSSSEGEHGEGDGSGFVSPEPTASTSTGTTEHDEGNKRESDEEVGLGDKVWSRIKDIFNKELNEVKDLKKRLADTDQEKQALKASLGGARGQIRSLREKLSVSQEDYKRTKWDLARSLSRFDRLDAKYSFNVEQVRKLADEEHSALENRLEMSQKRNLILEQSNEELHQSNEKLREARELERKAWERDREALEVAEDAMRHLESQNKEMLEEYGIKHAALDAKLKECEEILSKSSKKDTTIISLKENLEMSERKNVELSTQLRAERSKMASLQGSIVAMRDRIINSTSQITTETSFKASPNNSEIEDPNQATKSKNSEHASDKDEMKESGEHATDVDDKGSGEQHTSGDKDREAVSSEKEQSSSLQPPPGRSTRSKCKSQPDTTEAPAPKKKKRKSTPPIESASMDNVSVQLQKVDVIANAMPGSSMAQPIVKIRRLPE